MTEPETAAIEAPDETPAAVAPPALPPERLKAVVEAALLAASQPLSVTQLLELFEEHEGIDRAQVARALEALAADCDGRGVELKEVGSGFRYQVRQDVHPWVARMWTEKPSRYSRALMETLALIAYRQPITRPEIEQIRGVVVSSNIVKTLEEREWVRVVGHRDVPGKPALFGTTRAFLDYFNLKSLDELPTLAEIRDLDDPQLRFEPEPLPVHVPRDLPIDPDALDDGALNDAVGDQAEATATDPAASTQDDDAEAIDSASDAVTDASDAPTTTTEHHPDDADAMAHGDVSETHATADEATAPADTANGDVRKDP